MKNKKAILGIVVITLVVLSMHVLSRAHVRNSVPDDGPTIVGNWDDRAGTEFRFDDGIWESWFPGGFGTRGTYAASDGNITMELNEIFYGNEWVSYAQEPQTGTYSVIDDILVLTFNDEARRFTRRQER